MRFQIKKPKRMIFNKTKKTFRNKLKRKRKTTTITRRKKEDTKTTWGHLKLRVARN